MAFSGKVFKEYQSPIGGYHHDQFVMEDGNILMLTFDMYSGTVEDVCVLLDKNTGEVLRKWDYKDESKPTGMERIAAVRKIRLSPKYSLVVSIFVASGTSAINGSVWILTVLFSPLDQPFGKIESLWILSADCSDFIWDTSS